MNLKQYLDDQVGAALHEVVAIDAPAVVRQAGKPEFGHYQANGVMGAAKKIGSNPRELALQLIDALTLDAVADVEMAGPGFINITLKNEFLTGELARMYDDERLGVGTAEPQKIVVDYSSPNLAKEMHIGHLRSTAIGDTAVRILLFLGHEVIRANHMGDWGAQFGSLLAYMEMLENQGAEELSAELKDLEVFYQTASELFKTDGAFAEAARSYVVRLQGGDEKCLALWRRFITESISHCQAIYDRLDISLTPEDVKAESSYNDDLHNIISLLEAEDLIEVSDGAKCVFLDEFKGKDGASVPAIVQKSDGGFPYMTTDLAAARHRGRDLVVDRALYFVDGRQTLHFRQLYAVARAAGFIAPSQEFRHIPFGAILNRDGKPYKTREGGAVKLADVIDEAVERAFVLVNEKNPSLSVDDKREIAEVVGVGAIKYAELSKNRTTDYIFDWDTMLSFEGNTAPYLQYAYTRVQSIFRREDISPDSLQGEFVLDHDAELTLAVKLLQYPEAVEDVLEDFQANILCNYLFELSGHFMSFYEACPVLKAEEAVKNSRLKLCALTSGTLAHGLSLLGIRTVDEM